MLFIYQLVRVTRHLHDSEFEVIILKNHYCHLVEHSRKVFGNVFYSINNSHKSYLVVVERDDTSR